MKKRTKIIAGIVALALIGGGGIMLNNNYKTNGNIFDFTTRKDRQLAYLKEHEQEIIDFVKAQNPKIDSVQVDWENVKWTRSSFPFDETKLILIYGEINNDKESSWGMSIEYDDNQVYLETMTFTNDIRIGVEYFE